MNNAEHKYDTDRFYNPGWEDESMEKFDAERDMHITTIELSLRRFGKAKDYNADMVDVIDHTRFDKLRSEDREELNKALIGVYANASEGLKMALDRDIEGVATDFALMFMGGK